VAAINAAGREDYDSFILSGAVADRLNSAIDARAEGFPAFQLGRIQFSVTHMREMRAKSLSYILNAAFWSSVSPIFGFECADVLVSFQQPWQERSHYGGAHIFIHVRDRNGSGHGWPACRYTSATILPSA